MSGIESLLDDRNLYIHTPFCVRKCPYCHFASLPVSPPQNYTNVLLNEWQMRFSAAGSEMSTIYFGGGSPVLVPGRDWQHLLQTIKPVKNAELTMEINPELVTDTGVRVLEEIGINRMVLGVQSWQDKVLGQLGRHNRVSDNLKAWEVLKGSGLDNLALDLIYGVPHQTMQDWEESLRLTTTLGPKHISLYELDISDRNLNWEIASTSKTGRMWMLAHEMLTSAGYSHYEISNFSQPGYECRHNLAVWQGYEYRALGAGAHGRLGRKRYANASMPDCWERMLAEAKLPETMVWLMSEKEEWLWDVIMGLRTAQGIDLLLWKRNVPDVFCDNLMESGRIRIEDERVKLTLNGWLVSNRIFGELKSIIESKH